jgi:hypothetical protein
VKRVSCWCGGKTRGGAGDFVRMRLGQGAWGGGKVATTTTGHAQDDLEE